MEIIYNLLMAKKLNEIINRAEDFLFSLHSCICCSRECDSDSPYRICSRCLEKIEFSNKNYCLKCGVKIGEGYDYCLTCQDKSYYFDYARSVSTYDEVTAPMILKFKYNGLKTHRRPLGKILADYYSTSDIIADEATFVPMPRKREKKRGYNQAKELAEEFCALTSMPLVNVLIRTKENIKQATLSAKEREENIKGSFEVINKELIKGKDVLLIDDVLTTGATASECARVLKKAGARSVVVLTLAKTRLHQLNYEI